jgi:hypothetical protein
MGLPTLGFVCSFGCPFPSDGLEGVPCRRDPFVLVTAVNHSLATRKTISFVETLEFDYVSLFATSTTHATLEGAASALHKPLKVRLNVSNFEEVCHKIEPNIRTGAKSRCSHSETFTPGQVV